MENEEIKQMVFELFISSSNKIKNKKSRLLINHILSNHIQDFITLSYELDKKIQKQKFVRFTKLLNGYRDCAKIDIDACRVLLKNNIHHSLIAYHLQQGIEKIAKAYGLSSGFMSREDLKRVGHDSPLVFIKLCQKTIIKKYIGLFDIYEELSIAKIDKTQQIFSDTSSRSNLRKKIATCDKKDIEKWLDLGKKLRNRLIKQQDAINFISADINNILNEMKEISEEDKKNALHISETIMKNFGITHISNFMFLYILTVLTFPHAIFTRYPDTTIKYSDYKPGLGIIDSIENIIPEVDKCIDMLS